QCPIGSRNRGYSCRVRQTFGRGFVAKCVEVFRRRPDERNPGLLARACKRRALGEEPVARMNRVDALRLRDGNDGLNVQIRPDRFAALDGTNQKCLVSLEAVQGKTILVAVDGDGTQPKLSRGPEAADGNFRTIRDEQLTHTWSNGMGAHGITRPR